MSVVMVFLDGVGIGSDDSAVNPLMNPALRRLSFLLGGAPDIPPRMQLPFSVRPLDATLGIEGLPQSGTGQTTLFTGTNAAALINRHFGPYPHSALRPLLQEHNIFWKLKQAGRTCCFANAFPEKFFVHMKARPTRLTATTLSCTMAGIPLCTADDLRAGRAVSADITGQGWNDLGYPTMPVIEAEEAGSRLMHLSLEYDFVLFEYWKTDHAGHGMDPAESVRVLALLERMLDGFMAHAEGNDTLLLVTSDHGNIEDLSTKVHTRNPVPLALYGTGAGKMEEILGPPDGADLCCVTPAILRYLAEGGD